MKGKCESRREPRAAEKRSWPVTRGGPSNAEETIIRLLSRLNGGVLRKRNIIGLLSIERKRVNGIIMLFAGANGGGGKKVISVTVGFACPRCVVSTCRR